jgi:hypothetical protein
MPWTSTDLFHEWRAANRIAAAAEKAMLKDSIRALEGKGEPPSPADACRLKRLRADADDLFQLAMAQMGELALMARSGGRGVACPSGADRQKRTGLPE